MVRSYEARLSELVARQYIPPGFRWPEHRREMFTAMAAAFLGGNGRVAVTRFRRTLQWTSAAELRLSPCGSRSRSPLASGEESAAREMAANLGMHAWLQRLSEEQERSEEKQRQEILERRRFGLSAVGRTLFGDDWTGSMARELGFPEKTVKDWWSGSVPVPESQDARLSELARRAAMGPASPLSLVVRQADAVGSMSKSYPASLWF